MVTQVFVSTLWRRSSGGSVEVQY